MRRALLQTIMRPAIWLRIGSRLHVARRFSSMDIASDNPQRPKPNARSIIRTSPFMSFVRLKADPWPLRSARMTSNPLIVAQADFNVLKPRTGFISCFSLP